MMRTAGFAIAATALAATAMAATAAQAQPGLIIRDAVARVTIIPQDRTDIEVTVSQPASSLPRMTRRQDGDELILDGHLGRNLNCRGGRDGAPAEVSGDFGRVTLDQAPRIVARVPRSVRVSAGPAVFGDIGRSANVELNTNGCGTWTVANTAGDLEINTAGSGAVRAGGAVSAEVRSAGSGETRIRALTGGLRVDIAGSGDVSAAAVNGPIRARIAGSGDVRVDAGRAPELSVDIAGSGDVRFNGRADTVEANVVGSGDIRVREAGNISQRVMGSGDVRVGPIPAED